jgi:transposase-like protein
MARIRKEEHPRILHMVDVENRKVAEIATEYGCTPPTIYAVLSKLRRRTGDAQQGDGPAQPPLALESAPPMAAAVAAAVGHREATSHPAESDAPPPEAAGSDQGPDLEPMASVVPPDGDVNVLAFERAGNSVATEGQSTPSGESQVRPGRSAGGTGSFQRRTRGGGAPPVGARLAKPGFGLMMRTADGEENVTPFRSLEDLLSAIRPILRACANSPDPVWFSLQPVDLASVDVDAA